MDCAVTAILAATIDAHDAPRARHRVTLQHPSSLKLK